MTSDKEQFYAHVGLEGSVQMVNTTSGAMHVFSANPYLAGAYVVTNSRKDWSRFRVEVGVVQFAGFVRFRNAFSDECLSIEGEQKANFAQCDESDFDQVSAGRWRHDDMRRTEHVAFQFFSFETPPTSMPTARTIRPSANSGLCLQRRNAEFVDDNFANLLTL